MKTTQITNKETYLAYRSNWKALYKELSQTIRNAKFCCWYSSLGVKRQTPELQAKYESLKQWQGYSPWGVILEKPKATKLLEELKQAKLIAQQQYQHQQQELINK